jgi:nucleoside-diphosphate-sugar epimerase
LSNRNFLREQNRNNLSGKEDVFEIRNYQDLEIKVISGISVSEVFDKYNFIIYDECHMFFNDINLMDPNSLSEFRKDFDYIFHYSAINGTTNFYDNPNGVLENNLISDINVFKFAALCSGLKKLIWASSSEIVSDDPQKPVPENLDVLIKNIHNPRWSYRIAKIASENYLSNSKLPWLAIRYFNVYGENSKEGHFIGDQMKKMKSGTFNIIGANETRSFCYVSDAVRASIHLGLLDGAAVREVVNVGNNRELTIQDACVIISKALGYENVQFDELPSVSGSVANRQPDITKLRKLMPGYSPISFEEGISKIIKG